MTALTSLRQIKLNSCCQICTRSLTHVRPDHTDNPVYLTSILLNRSTHTLKAREDVFEMRMSLRPRFCLQALCVSRFIHRKPDYFMNDYNAIGQAYFGA